jgi:hypoxanthine-DNA glycosylase
MMTNRRSQKEGVITAKQQETTVASSVGFPPVAREDARILVLGSLPGQRSLQAGQYYAHPQNAFWKIMHDLTGASGTYEQRCDALRAHRIALWDVLASSVRPGSMDADIAMDTAEVNDFKGFFSTHRAIERVCFNGRKAGHMFQRLVALDEAAGPRQFETLPSTSPAYASMTYTEKLAKWRDAIA